MEKKKDKKKVFPCPLCQKGVEIKISKKQKPYCVCLDCGVQLFVRGKEGINRLEKKAGFELESFDTCQLNQGSKTLNQRKTELLKEQAEIDAFDDWLEGL